MDIYNLYEYGAPFFAAFDRKGTPLLKLYFRPKQFINHSFIPPSMDHLSTFARKFSTTQIFFILLLQSDNELPMSEMQNNWGITNFVLEIKRVENYPNFDKSALITRHGLNRC